MGIHPTLLSQVLKEKKELSSEQWMQFCSILELTSLEKEYLVFLHLKNRAGTKELRDYYQSKLDIILQQRLELKSKFQNYKELSDKDRAIYYSTWLYAAIRIYCAIDNGKSIDDICNKFQITKNYAQEILDFLCVTGLCVLEKNKYKMGTQHLHVPDNSPFLNKHHLNWRLKSIQALDSVQKEDIHLTSAMSISKKDFESIREKLTDAIQESVKIAKESNAEDVVVLTLDYFWLKK